MECINQPGVYYYYVCADISMNRILPDRANLVDPLVLPSSSFVLGDMTYQAFKNWPILSLVAIDVRLKAKNAIQAIPILQKEHSEYKLRILTAQLQ